MAIGKVKPSGDARLAGTWKLLSWEREFRDSAKREQPVGRHPNGMLMLSANGRMMDLVTASDRHGGDTDAQHAVLFRTMLAYSGQYRTEGDRFITKVLVSWNEVWNGSEQERYYKIKGDRLDIISAWAPHPSLPGSPIVRNRRTWKREV